MDGANNGSRGGAGGRDEGISDATGGQRRCKGIVKRTGERCKNPPAPGRDFCKAHLKNRPTGRDHWNYKHGRYTNDVLSKDFRERLETEAANAELLELRGEIDVLRARAGMVMQTGESTVAWADAVEAFEVADEARRPPIDAGELIRAMNTLGHILRTGLADHRHFDELDRRFETIRRLVDSEHKHRIDERIAVTYEEMAATTSTIVEVFYKLVKDQETRDAFNNEIRSILAGRPDRIRESAPFN